MTNSGMDRLQRRAAYWFIALIFYHTIFLLLSGYMLYTINLTGAGSVLAAQDTGTFWVSTALIGFSGSLLYFSRKTYVYLMTNKISRIKSELEVGDAATLSDASTEERYRARLTGYYVYLAVRPVGGLAIGPLVTMIILGGLTTLSKTANLNASALSAAGVYIVYVFSFIGGYISSDLFDYLSRTGGRILTKSGEK
jgi:hypothetical protein